MVGLAESKVALKILSQILVLTTFEISLYANIWNDNFRKSRVLLNWLLWEGKIIQGIKNNFF